MSKISVIIAAYNVEEYIAETLNSVIGQTLKDIEIVVVNDCSTDSTLEIITEFAEHDNRIKIVNNEENSGLVRVRQIGLKNSEGEFIMFLDGDDKLVPNACEKAYKAITGEKVDMLQFNVNILFAPPMKPDPEVEKNLRVAMHSITHKVVSLSKAGLVDEKAVGDIINFTLWDKIYKRTLLERVAEHVPCEYLNMAEDVLYSFLIHYHAHSYSYISDKLYDYRYGCGMSTTPSVSERLMKFIAKNAYVYNYIKKWVKSQGAEKECKLSLCRAHRKTYTHITETYFYRAKGEQREFFASEVLKYADPEDFVLAIMNHMYDRGVSSDIIAKECAKLSIFSSKKTEAKTIGVYYYRMYNGGVESVISSLADIWVKAGYNVVLFTDEKPNKNDYYINPSVKRVIVPALNENDFFDRQDRINAFSQGLIENNVDIMVYNAWGNYNIVLDEMTIKSCGVNLIIHTHNMFCCETASMHAPTAYFYSSLPTLYTFADSVIALSDVDAKWWEMTGVRCLKTRNPIQINTDVEPASLSGKNILFVGRISEEKRVIDALQIVKLVKEEIPDVKLTVVGKGDDPGYVASVDDFIADNNLGSFVNMVGFKSDVIPYYQSADVMLATSRIEGAPLSWLEGKICGLPLVCYSLPHLDFTRECKGMIVVDQLDTRAAAAAIVRILKDDALKKELGKQARESAEDYLNIDLAEHWKNIFEQSLTPKPKEKAIYELSPSEIAVRLAVENYTMGIANHADSGAGNSSSKCAMLEDELERFKRSETYRVGKIVTFIPRMLKKLLKKILQFFRG